MALAGARKHAKVRGDSLRAGHARVTRVPVCCRGRHCQAARRPIDIESASDSVFSLSCPQAGKMVVDKASIMNIMGGMESTAGVRLHNHRRKLRQRYGCTL